jgi:hypothetical protein
MPEGHRLSYIETPMRCGRFPVNNTGFLPALLSSGSTHGGTSPPMRLLRQEPLPQPLSNKSPATTPGQAYSNKFRVIQPLEISRIKYKTGREIYI